MTKEGKEEKKAMKNDSHDSAHRASHRKRGKEIDSAMKYPLLPERVANREKKKSILYDSRVPPPEMGSAGV